MTRASPIAVVLLAIMLGGCGKGTTIVITAPTQAVASPIGTTRVYRVPSASMEPTIIIGGSVIVTPGQPRVGEIVVFHPPQGAAAESGEPLCGPAPHVVPFGHQACSQPVANEARVTFIKRIVAGPADQIYIREGHVFRKPQGTSTFAAEPDSYIKPCQPQDPKCNFPEPITIPPGHWFMLGDNRGESDDSRFWGPVPTSSIEGVVTLTTPAGG